MERPNLLAFVGMPGSGKSTCVDYLKSKGYPSVYFGGLVVDEVKNRGLGVNEINERAVREEFRATHGMAAMAVLAETPIVKMLEEHGAGIIDGLYGWSELQYLRERFVGITVVALVTNRAIRYERLASRPTRPLTHDEVQTRDISEIENLEKGGPIAYADYYLENNDLDTARRDHLHSKIDAILAKIDFADLKK